MFILLYAVVHINFAELIIIILLTAKTITRAAKLVLRAAKTITRAAKLVLRAAKTIMRAAKLVLRAAKTIMRAAKLVLRAAKLVLRAAKYKFINYMTGAGILLVVLCFWLNYEMSSNYSSNISTGSKSRGNTCSAFNSMFCHKNNVKSVQLFFDKIGAWSAG